MKIIIPLACVEVCELGDLWYVKCLFMVCKIGVYMLNMCLRYDKVGVYDM